MELHVKRFNELTLDELYELLKLRVSVFVVEQNCPYPELDDRDQNALHLWYEDEGEMIAYLRIMDRGAVSDYVSIGRVIAVKRRQGIATRLVSDAVRTAKEQFAADRIYLEAQVYAKGLYEKLGFREVSDVFLEDGIPHVKMILEC
ncbi:MAG: GNAT family N-acetyltransferase [Solobacterium sp.]|nr:GNAT family N-acetyltransferase [Erysipelotrichaceae bacterium]MBQ1324857.1 GNAT family N-acetyltransferase [Solobacterium sp.]MBQ1447004.1 GNAT family N-acetyltransferase [Solobacterium sp.]MBQ2689426.1 GNAT family N-acetyltransferase [Solobacterium sp.]MBQ6591810.1 GNAT family N-acetyltransferase [Solobacterium sp.]